MISGWEWKCIRAVTFHEELSGFRGCVVPVELRNSLGLLCCWRRSGNITCPILSTLGFAWLLCFSFRIQFKGNFNFPDKQQGSSRKSLFIFWDYFNLFLIIILSFLRSENEAALIECSTGSSALVLTHFKDSPAQLGRNFLTPGNSASRRIGKQICRFTNWNRKTSFNYRSFHNFFLRAFSLPQPELKNGTNWFRAIH